MISLNNLLTKFRKSKTNYIVYYENNIRYEKLIKDLYTDVAKTIQILRQMGLKRKDRIAIVGKNSYMWIVLDLACIISGIFVAAPDNNFIGSIPELFEFFELKYLFSNMEQYYSDDKVVSFDSIKDALNSIENIPEDIVMNDYDENDVFTTIFSSGTCGKARAVEVRVKCFDDIVTNTDYLFNFNTSDMVMIFLPLYVYLQRVYIYAAILFEFNILLAPPELIIKAMKQDNPTVIIAIPLFFENIYKVFNQQIRLKPAGYLLFQFYNLLKKIGLGFVFNHTFKPFKNIFGKRIRYLLTGSGPSRYKILKFYDTMGITLYNCYGLSEIAGIITLNSPGHNCIGSVGIPFPNKTVKIADDGEIMVKGDYVANNSYLKVPSEENGQVYLPDGFIRTGDIGFFDKNGFLFLNGRKDDLIVLNNGNKIHPAIIEEKLNAFEIVENSLLYGDRQDFLTALIIPANKSITMQMLEDCIKIVNEELTNGEKIRKYFINYEKFTIENNMITKNLKLNRRYIVNRYNRNFLELYKTNS